MSSLLNRILDLSCNKFVEACAGAGKTFALSKRYCAIIDDFIEKNSYSTGNDDRLGIENILVITFTKKATAEMAEDIYHDLNKLLNREEIENVHGLGKNLVKASEKDITWLRATFSRNAISTIDSFCARILRENADTLGLDPEFSVIEPAEYKRRFDLCLNDYLQKKSREHDNDLRILLEYQSINRLYLLFNNVHKHLQFIAERLSKLETMSEDAVFKEWLSLYTPDIETEKVIDMFRKIADYSEIIGTDPEDAGYVWLQRLNDILTAIPEECEARKQYVLTDLIPVLFTIRGKYKSPRSVPGNKNNWSDRTAFSEFKDHVRELLVYLKDMVPEFLVLQTPNKNDRISINVIRSLLTLYREFSGILAENQRMNNYLGFNDIIILAGKLLKEHPSIRSKYSKKFKHIMIDEFQDTNYPRWDIIRMIASDDNGNLHSNGLFIVGDKKQSVYRFNQADVEVVDTVKEEFKTVMKAGDDVFIELNENYRASTEYIDNVINPVFSEVFQVSKDYQKMPYEADFAKTKPAGPQNEKIEITSKTENPCSIRISLSDKNDPIHAGALNTALAVKELLEWGNKCGLAEKDEAFVGVLLRRFTNIQNYLRIFQEYSIPFEIVSGRHLYNQQETHDLFHLVSILYNPHDDLALLGLLRSPVFCLPDKTIHKLRQNSPKQECSLYKQISSDPDLKRITDSIDCWRDAVRIRPLDRLLEDILSTDHRELGYYSEAGGKQRIANIDKIIGIIHGISSRGAGLREVFEYLRYSISHDPDSAQAGTGENAPVQILTIHKSKGLEFPAVVIPELNTAGGINDNVLPFGKIKENNSGNEHFELSIPITAEDDISLGQGIVNGLKYYESLRDVAEDKRLFYVALTRAKYRVVLLADHRDGGKGKHSKWWWTNYISPVFGIPVLSKLSESEPVQSKIPLTEIKVIHKNEILKNLDIHSKSHEKPLEWKEPTVFEEPEKFYNYSVYDLVEYLDPGIENYDAGAAEKLEPAIKVGTIFHTIMENEWWKPECTVEIEKYINDRYPGTEARLLLRLTGEHVDNLRKSSLLNNIINSNDRYYELPVIGWFRSGKNFFQVSGKIDLLYRTGQNWYIVDFKTSRSMKTREKHELQVKIYMLMIKQIYNIEAAGNVYYSSMNSLIQAGKGSKNTGIDLEQDNQIKSEYENRQDLPDIENILTEDFEGKTIIICPTKHNSLKVTKILYARGLLTPEISISTLDTFTNDIDLPGIPVSSGLRRLLIRKSVNNPDTPPGKIEMLSKAFQNAEEGNAKLNENARQYFREYEKMKNKLGIITETDRIRKIGRELSFSGTRIILNKMYKTSREYFKLFKTIASKSESFYFVDNFNNGKLSRKFNYDHTIWDEASTFSDMSSDQLYTKCKSQADEVETCAKMIRGISDWESRQGSLKIAVSSMEKYVPLIKKIFNWYGIPVTVAKNEPVLERPASQLLLRFLDLLDVLRYPEWIAVTGVVLHPMCMPLEEYFELDLWCRKNNIRYFREIPDRLENSDLDEDEKKNHLSAYEKIGNTINKYSIGENAAHSEIGGILNIFMDDIDLRSQMNLSMLSRNIYDKLVETIEKMIWEYDTAGMKCGLSMFRIDLLTILSEIVIPTGEQDHGIEILGFFDTLHLNPVKLFILGLTEDEFPVTPPFNPYIEKFQDHSWILSLQFFVHWKSLGDKVHFFASVRDKDDETLQPSTFTEFLKRSNQSAVEYENCHSPRDHYAEYTGRQISAPGLNEHFLLRHNAYLSGDVNDYRGSTGRSETTEIVFSPSELDILLNCPMQYWYKNLLKVGPGDLDEDLKRNMLLGKVVHKALERFGILGGFKRYFNDPGAACRILEEELRRILPEFGFDLDQDLITDYMLAPYLKGLAKQDSGNILVKLLEWNRDNFSEFVYDDFEKWFQSPVYLDTNHSILKDGELKISFKGKVDKILINEKTNTVIATDYKTGSVSRDLITEHWSSQFPVYYLLLKDKYPDKRIKLVYEQVKSNRENGLKYFSGDLDETELKKGILFDDEFFSVTLPVILEFCNKILNGKYGITERFLNKRPCGYCSYIGICRKDS